MKVYDIKNLEVTLHEIRFEISGNKIIVPLDKTVSTVLPTANLQQLKTFEMDPYGIGIHWPLLDEDYSIAGFLKAAGREDLIVDPASIQSPIETKVC